MAEAQFEYPGKTPWTPPPTPRPATGNPYWDAVKDHAKPSTYPWEHGLMIEQFDFRDGLNYQPTLDRHDYCRQYAWSVTDPDSVEFVTLHTLPDGLVDPIAGTGYWAYVLSQLNVDVVCYDIAPGEQGNAWHKDAELWTPVEKMDGPQAVTKHPDRVLLLAWPPYSQPVGENILAAYQGHKVIYIGEGEGGCTGDDPMFELLRRDWHETADHTPVQWWGLHDYITVYERNR